jgi:signal transduction histidine kinase
VRDLEAATARLASGRLTQPPPSDAGPPEVRRLAATFTDTAGRLQTLIESQRAFAADASHQLKTPLTALRLRLENLEPDLHPRAHASLDAAVGETERLTRIVQGLLALARLENSAVERAPVDVEALIADRADSWAPFAAEHDVGLAVTGRPAGPAWAVPGAVDQILDNLLANALRVAPPGSTLIIDRRTRAEWVEVHVVDEGPGLSPADRRRAFDRFWRAPDATDDGSGLGLAIVARLVAAGGGTIALDEAPGGGIDAVLRLPAARHATRAPARHRTAPVS